MLKANPTEMYGAFVRKMKGMVVRVTLTFTKAFTATLLLYAVRVMYLWPGSAVQAAETLNVAVIAFAVGPIWLGTAKPYNNGGDPNGPSWPLVETFR